MVPSLHCVVSFGRDTIAAPQLWKAALVALALVFVACGGRQPIASYGDVTIEGELSDEMPDLNGTWARLEVTSTLATVPMLGEIRTLNRTIVLVDVRQEDNSVHLRGTVCGMEVETDNRNVNTVIPDPYVAAIAPFEAHATVVETENGYTLSPSTYVMLVGYEAVDGDDAIPSSADDPRVVDADGDGHPGLTMRVEGLASGEMYVVQRVARTLNTERLVGDHHDGEIDWLVERNVLGATSGRLERSRDQPRDPDGPNFFVSSRVADGTTCVDILSEPDTHFVR